MKTYEQGKAELDAELKRLNDAIKFAKRNITYDFKCPQCKKTTKKVVMWAKIGGGIGVCSEKCRSAKYREKREQSSNDYKSDIQSLKQKIKELENEV